LAQLPRVEHRLPDAADAGLHHQRRRTAARQGARLGGSELRLRNGWSLIGKFDGEFASRLQSYAGTGTVRYIW